MPLLDYTTKIGAYQSVGEIQNALAKHGARRIMQEYGEQGNVKALSFEIETRGGLRTFRLPANTDKVFCVLKKQKIKCDERQAERVAWRIIKGWIDVQMAILETEMVAMDQIFLPYMTNKDGETVYSLYLRNQTFLPGQGETR